MYKGKSNTAFSLNGQVLCFITFSERRFYLHCSYLPTKPEGMVSEVGSCSLEVGIPKLNLPLMFSRL